jgi:AcrR family transcriptional regulator
MDAPARRTRPRNRRALTLISATTLFYRDGYSSVSMSDIAVATNVGPSAIYRHFGSKADILVAAIEEGLAPFTEVLSRALAGGSAALPFGMVLTGLAECAIDHREPGVLWQRDARGLDEDRHDRLRDQVRAMTHLLAQVIQAVRPELDGRQTDVVAWCCFGVLGSIGFHSLTLPRDEFVALMVDLIEKVTFAPLSHVTASSGGATSAPPPETRREQLITVATELFAERGFGAVGVDDIAEAAGIAGPSIYAHFPSKIAILAAAIERASDLAQAERAAVLASDSPPAVGLSRLVGSYVAMANRDRYIPRTLISEMDRLPEDDRATARRTHSDYIDTWVDLLRQCNSESPIAARIRVQAVLLVVNDAVQTPHLRSQPGFEQILLDIAHALLGIKLGAVASYS